MRKLKFGHILYEICMSTCLMVEWQNLIKKTKRAFQMRKKWKDLESKAHNSWKFGGDVTPETWTMYKIPKNTIKSNGVP